MKLRMLKQKLIRKRMTINKYNLFMITVILVMIRKLILKKNNYNKSTTNICGSKSNINSYKNIIY